MTDEYASRNIEARSLNHCCSWKAINIIYYECAFVTFVIQHAKRTHPTALSLWLVSDCHIFPCSLIKGYSLQKKVIEHKMLVLIFSKPLTKTFILRRIERDIKKFTQVFMWISHHACHFLIKLGFALQIFEKSTNIHFHENPSNESRVICGRTDGQTDRQTDRQKYMTWPIVTFRSVVSAPIEFPYNTLQVTNSCWYRYIKRGPRMPWYFNLKSVNYLQETWWEYYSHSGNITCVIPDSLSPSKLIKLCEITSWLQHYVYYTHSI